MRHPNKIRDDVAISWSGSNTGNSNFLFMFLHVYLVMVTHDFHRYKMSRV